MSSSNECIADFTTFQGIFGDVVPGTLAADQVTYPGQVEGAGCVYPRSAQTIGDQLDAMRYADERSGAIAGHLAEDLAQERTTPRFAFITPDLCNDGHDATCAGPNTEGNHTGGLVGADLWLKHWMPLLLGSPAYRDGHTLIVVTFDEPDPFHDATACCNEGPGPSWAWRGYASLLSLFGLPAPTQPGQYPGGGRVGAVLLNAKYIQPAPPTRPRTTATPPCAATRTCSVSTPAARTGTGTSASPRSSVCGRSAATCSTASIPRPALVRSRSVASGTADTTKLTGVSEAARTRRSYDEVADQYAAKFSDELQHKPLDRALLDAFAELTMGGCVADIGCGPGHVAAYLARRGGWTVGLDLSPGMCVAARRANPLPMIAADMTALPVRTEALTGVVCMYAVIHLDSAQRRLVYEQFARALRSGGHALIAFHMSDPEVEMGGAKTFSDWWGHEVDLTFRFLDPSAETSALNAAGLGVVARLDREPDPATEHPSRRCYLLARRL